MASRLRGGGPPATAAPSPDRIPCSTPRNCAQSPRNASVSRPASACPSGGNCSRCLLRQSAPRLYRWNRPAHDRARWRAPCQARPWRRDSYARARCSDARHCGPRHRSPRAPPPARRPSPPTWQAAAPPRARKARADDGNIIMPADRTLHRQRPVPYHANRRRISSVLPLLSLVVRRKCDLVCLPLPLTPPPLNARRTSPQGARRPRGCGAFPLLPIGEKVARRVG